MTRLLPFTSVMTTATAFAALCAGAGVANAADGFTQNNLVSNMAGLATTTNSSLVNPWGVSFANGSPVWISDQATQTSPLFSVTGSTGVGNAPLFTVNIPPAGAAGPTGQVANASGSGFDVERGEWRRRLLHLCQPERLDLRLEWHPAHPSIHPNVRRGRELHRARHQ